MGHADSVGSDEYNLQLSRLRAEAVARYLVSKGISPERISVEGYGSSRPIGKNDTEEGRSKNRRVDIKFDK
jgi:outer membrane protein OmpA-like peptidoglycan-associated protein